MSQRGGCCSLVLSFDPRLHQRRFTLQPLWFGGLARDGRARTRASEQARALAAAAAANLASRTRTSTVLLGAPCRALRRSLLSLPCHRCRRPRVTPAAQLWTAAAL
jgi:hypothetical protein